MTRVLLLILMLGPQVLWAQSFHYPVVPDTVVGRQAKVHYMVDHFWNTENVADTATFQRPTVLMDYLYLLRQTDTRHAVRSICDFITLSCRQEHTFGLMLYWLDNILYDASSPHYNERLYEVFLRAVIASKADSVMKLIPRQRLDIISKNRVGEPASNFSFTTHTGTVDSLYHVQAPLLLLLFNNPDCSVCRKTEERIATDSLLCSLLQSGRLRVLAVAPDADVKEWQRHASPEGWLSGIDINKRIVTERLYDIQRFPSIYLLDHEKRVLLKEADFDRLMRYVSRHLVI